MQSHFGEASAEGGGRRKRLFMVTTAGEQALRESRSLRNELWDSISETAEFGIAEKVGRIALGFSWF